MLGRNPFFSVYNLSIGLGTKIFLLSLRDFSCVFLKRDAALVMVHSKSVCNLINKYVYEKNQKYHKNNRLAV